MNQIGIDVSSETLDATRQQAKSLTRRQFPNTPAGHRACIRWALQRTNAAQVCCEATGIYHLQLALCLHAHPHIELMVLNPCAARRFTQAHMVRAKTDAIDADGLLLFLQRMPFQPWLAPPETVLQLQSLAHRMGQLGQEVVRERCRLHAAHKAGPHTRMVQRDIKAHIKHLQRRLQRIREHTAQTIQHDASLANDARLIDSAPGFAELSVIKLLAELAALPDDMVPAQWVAQAGLDPRPVESGTSQRSPRRISKQGNVRIRAALYMPALVAAHHDEHVSAYYQHLLNQGKPKMVALTAVMRKLLHALWGMLHHQQEWDGNKFYRLDPA